MRWTLAIALVTAAYGCKKSSGPCDMSTDAKAIAAYNELTGKDIKADDGNVCFTRSEKFPGLLEVGQAVSEGGCLDQVIVWQCKIVNEKPVAEILQSVGWKTADAKRREQIAADWLDPVTTDRPPFEKAGKPFTAPTYDHAPDGAVTVTYWAMTGGGNLAGIFYVTKWRTTIAADGSIAASKKLDSFESHGN